MAGCVRGLLCQPVLHCASFTSPFYMVGGGTLLSFFFSAVLGMECPWAADSLHWSTMSFLQAWRLKKLKKLNKKRVKSSSKKCVYQKGIKCVSSVLMGSLVGYGIAPFFLCLLFSQQISNLWCVWGVYIHISIQAWSCNHYYSIVWKIKICWTNSRERSQTRLGVA